MPLESRSTRQLFHAKGTNDTNSGEIEGYTQSGFATQLPVDGSSRKQRSYAGRKRKSPDENNESVVDSRSSNPDRQSEDNSTPRKRRRMLLATEDIIKQDIPLHEPAQLSKAQPKNVTADLLSLINTKQKTNFHPKMIKQSISPESERLEEKNASQNLSGYKIQSRSPPHFGNQTSSGVATTLKAKSSDGPFRNGQDAGGLATKGVKMPRNVNVSSVGVSSTDLPVHHSSVNEETKSHGDATAAANLNSRTMEIRKDPWHGMHHVSRRDVQIPKDQQDLLNRTDCWLPPEPGTSHPLANLPVSILKDLAIIADKHIAQRQPSVSLELGIKDLDDDTKETGSPQLHASVNHQHSESPQEEISLSQWPPSANYFRLPPGDLPPDSSIEEPTSKVATKYHDDAPSSASTTSSASKCNAAQVDTMQPPIPNLPKPDNSHTTNSQLLIRDMLAVGRNIDPSVQMSRENAGPSESGADANDDSVRSPSKLDDNEVFLQEPHSLVENSTPPLPHQNEHQFINTNGNLSSLHARNARRNSGESDIETALSSESELEVSVANPLLRHSIEQPRRDTIQYTPPIRDVNRSSVIQVGRTPDVHSHLPSALQNATTHRCDNAPEGSDHKRFSREDMIPGTFNRSAPETKAPDFAPHQADSKFVKSGESSGSSPKRKAPDADIDGPRNAKRRKRVKLPEITFTEKDHNKDPCGLERSRRAFFETRSQQKLVQTVYLCFKDAYAEYKGNEKHFTLRCRRIATLEAEDRMEHKSLWDDWVIRHLIEYQQHILSQAEQAMDPLPYEKFYRCQIEEPKYVKHILNPSNLHEALQLDSAANSPQVSPAISPPATPPNAKFPRQLPWKIGSERSPHPVFSSARKSLSRSSPPSGLISHKPAPSPSNSATVARQSSSRSATFPEEKGPPSSYRYIASSTIDPIPPPAELTATSRQRSSRSGAPPARHQPPPSTRSSASSSAHPVRALAARTASAVAAVPPSSSPPQGEWWRDPIDPFKEFARKETSAVGGIGGASRNRNGTLQRKADRKTIGE